MLNCAIPAKEKNCKLIFINKKEIKITPSTQSNIRILPLQARIQLDEFSYPAIHIYGTIDNTNLDIYSAKHKIKNNTNEDSNGTSQSLNNSCS